MLSTLSKYYVALNASYFECKRYYRAYWIRFLQIEDYNGSGEHILLQIQQQTFGTNTQFVQYIILVSDIYNT